MASLACALLPLPGRPPPSPSGSSTANIAAAVISANTNHKFIETSSCGALSMRRFTLPAPRAAIDNCQFHGIAGRNEKTSYTNWLADAEFDAAGDVLAMRIARLEEIDPGPDRLGKPDPKAANGHGRVDGGDRLGQCRTALLVDQHDLRPHHQVPVCRSDNAVLEFNKINGSVHAAGNGIGNRFTGTTVRIYLTSVNRKLNRGEFDLCSGAQAHQGATTASERKPNRPRVVAGLSRLA